MSNKISLNGRETVERDVKIEVDREALVEAVINLFKIKHKVFTNFDHVEKGFLYKYSYFDLHKREDVYKKDREATKEEIKLFAKVDFLESLKRG